MSSVDTLRFLNASQVRQIQNEFGTPVFIYDQATLEASAQKVLAFPNVYGLTARYAMKALPNAAVLQIFHKQGLHIDASSGYEAERAMLAGIPATNIQITAQQIPDNLKALVEKGCLYNACSLHQLRSYGELFPATEVSVRINPGLGSGHSNRTNVGGPASSFGIWHAHLDEVKSIAAEHNLKITGMHTHIGSGSDPDTWVKISQMSLEIAAQLPDVVRFSLGGGYKVGRMPGEVTADLQSIGAQVLPAIEAFAENHGRKLHLEVEPGTFLVANAGALIAEVCDIMDTGNDGYTFIKINAGMTEVLRPSLYGAQHPIITVPSDENTGSETQDYIVSGHCCESGDVLTPAPGDPEGLLPRTLQKVQVGDAVVIEGAGAYCASMASKNYNSFPECAEVLLQLDGTFRLIRKAQTLDQVLQNEV